MILMENNALFSFLQFVQGFLIQVRFIFIV